MEFKNKSTKIAGLILILAGLALLLSRHHWNRGAKFDTSDRDRASLATLNDSSSDEKSRYEALLFLGRSQNPQGFQIAKKVAADFQNPYLQQGALFALGYFQNDEALEILKPFLTSADSATRRCAIESLGEASQDGRAKILNEFLGQENIDPRDRALATLSLLKQRESADEAENLINGLVKSLRDQPADLRTQVILDLVSTLPQNPSVIALLQKEIEDGKDPRVIAVGLRHLSVYRPDWVNSRLEKFSKSSSPEIRRSVVQAVLFSCPKNRWELVTAMARTEKNPMVQNTLVDLPLQMKEPEAKNFLQTLSRLFPGLNEAIQKNLLQIDEKPLVDPCHKP